MPNFSKNFLIIKKKQKKYRIKQNPGTNRCNLNNNNRSRMIKILSLTSKAHQILKSKILQQGMKLKLINKYFKIWCNKIKKQINKKKFKSAKLNYYKMMKYNWKTEL